jgi:ubiquinone/menaquinone biosynthesis C-methylase UbiE
VLQHVPDPALAASELARVTRPGGRIAVIEFDLGGLLIDSPTGR